MKRFLLTLLALLAASSLAWAIVQRLQSAEAAGEAPRAPAPVEVEPVRRGPVVLRRTFSGTLEASAEFVAAPRVPGRLIELAVDLGDVVERGQVVARLDDAELAQAERQAEAEQAVAEAGLAEAEAALVISERALVRIERLIEEGVSSDAQLDAARSGALASRARLQVAVATVEREGARLEAARIRRAEAEVTADWREGDDRRVVGQRFVDEGGNVSAGTPLLSIVAEDSLVCAIDVPERDYGLLAVGQTARLLTDSHPGRDFHAEVARISPVFRDTTRQARVELKAENTDRLLKPGMFVRATLELQRVEDALIVPAGAVTERAGIAGVFVIGANSESARWCEVELGVRDGDQLQVIAEGLEGSVVVMGQELCEDGSPIRVVTAPGDGSEL